MENMLFDRLNSNHSLNYGTTVNSTSGGPSVRQAILAAEQADQPSGGQASSPTQDNCERTALATFG